MLKSLTCLLLIIIVNYSSAQWVELNSGVTTRLNSISSVKDLCTWACGAGGTVLKSSNMGDSWQNGNQSGIPLSASLNHIFCINENIVLCSGIDGSTAYLYKTINGGITWNIVHQQASGKFNALHFIDGNTGMLVGDPVGGRWSIWKTINGGNSWDSTGCYLAQNGSEKGFNNSLWAAGDKIWFGTDNFKIYKTPDYSATWQVQSTGSEKNSASLWFDFDFNIGLTGSSNLLRTFNSGSNWNIESIPGSGNIIAVTGSAHSRFNWAIRSDNKIYLNPHNTNIWQLDYTAPNGNYTYMTIERNGYFSGAVFATRDNGGISRTYFLSLGISTISSEIPVSFKLHQNYPNPFNPVTKFRFDIKRSGNVKINIFDIGGKAVKELLNSNMEAGTFEVDWNAAEYPSGVYFYRLVSGDFTDTKKMILVK